MPLVTLADATDPVATPSIPPKSAPTVATAIINVGLLRNRIALPLQRTRRHPPITSLGVEVPDRHKIVNRDRSDDTRVHRRGWLLLALGGLSAEPAATHRPFPHRGHLGQRGSQLQPLLIRTSDPCFLPRRTVPPTFMYGPRGHPDPYAAAIQLTPIIWGPPCTPTTAPNVPIRIASRGKRGAMRSRNWSMSGAPPCITATSSISPAALKRS